MVSDGKWSTSNPVCLRRKDAFKKMFLTTLRLVINNLDLWPFDFEI